MTTQNETRVEPEVISGTAPSGKKCEKCTEVERSKRPDLWDKALFLLLEREEDLPGGYSPGIAQRWPKRPPKMLTKWLS